MLWATYDAVHIVSAIKLGNAAPLKWRQGMSGRWLCTAPSRCSAFVPAPLAQCRQKSQRSQMRWTGAFQPSSSPGRRRQSWRLGGPPSAAHSWPSGRSAPPATPSTPQVHECAQALLLQAPFMQDREDLSTVWREGRAHAQSDCSFPSALEEMHRTCPGGPCRDGWGGRLAIQCTCTV